MRTAADHGDYALPLGIVQQRFGVRPLRVIERTVQATAIVAVSALADSFPSEGKHLRHLWRGGSPAELPERQGA